MKASNLLRAQPPNTQGEHTPAPHSPADAAGRKRRGRLKIFLGAASGIGTTCEMIRAGITKYRMGMDVVVGAVETRGRKETEALLKQLEVIPGHGAASNCRQACEMDLDVVLARRPKLNAPGSQYPKRYMDVRVLLRAGIDVYTTLNMQQVESLSNIVTKITHIRNGETVPDSIVNQADEIEVIDVPPSDVLRRLRGCKLALWLAAS